MNKLIVIGWIGVKRCYLNISREEAIRRYEAAEGCSGIESTELIDEFEFEDEFGAYEVWGP